MSRVPGSSGSSDNHRKLRASFYEYSGCMLFVCHFLQPFRIHLLDSVAPIVMGDIDRTIGGHNR